MIIEGLSLVRVKKRNCISKVFKANNLFQVEIEFQNDYKYPNNVHRTLKLKVHPRYIKTDVRK